MHEHVPRTEERVSKESSSNNRPIHGRALNVLRTGSLSTSIQADSNVVPHLMHRQYFINIPRIGDTVCLSNGEKFLDSNE